VKNDSIRQFISLRTALVQEKSALVARLREIEEALAGNVSTVARGIGRNRVARRAAAHRLKNPMSLKAAVVKVTPAKPATKDQILAGVRKLGYRSATSDPMNSLNVVLYSGKAFKNAAGKFSPAK